MRTMGNVVADQHVKLGEILIKKKWLDSKQLEHVLTKQKSTCEFLGQILLKEKLITEEQLIAALSEQFHIPCAHLKNFPVDWNLVMKFSASLILDHKCFPLRCDGETLMIGITNPLDVWALSAVKTMTQGYSAKLVLVTESEMRKLLDGYRQYVNIRIRRSLEETG